jgi:hypothetical protein
MIIKVGFLASATGTVTASPCLVCRRTGSGAASSPSLPEAADILRPASGEMHSAGNVVPIGKSMLY